MKQSLHFIHLAKLKTRAAGRGLFLLFLLLTAVKAHATCTAGFTYSKSGKNVTFTNTSTGTTSNTYYHWNFGDGHSSTSANPSHSYTSTGIYAVSLVIIDSTTSCYDNFQDSISLDSCVADFSKTNSFSNVNFSAIYIGAGGSYHWNFGDGTSTTTSSQYASHTYSAGGTYQVCLVISNGSCHDSICKNVTVAGPNACNAGFTWTQSSLGHITFTNTSTGFSGGSQSYNWQFGDGTTGTGTNPTHGYSINGQYVVTLSMQSVSAADTCHDSYSDTISVTGGCSADFTSYDMNGLNVQFYPRNSTYNSYEWYFGDGDTSTTQNANHTYDSAGDYTVCLVIHGDSGCVDSVCKNIHVIFEQYNLTGRVYLADTSLDVDSAVVYLIQYDATDSTLTLVDSTEIYSNSMSASFAFANLPTGHYLVKAALRPSAAHYSDYIPTYADTSVLWSGARTINLNGNTSVYFVLKAGTNTGGPGFIGGKVTQGANKKEGDPLEGIQVMLLNPVNKQPYRYTYSDKNGEFKFADLAYGNYEVYTEVIGLETNSATVTLNQDKPAVTNVEVKISSSGVTTGFRNKITSIVLGLKAYPNPVKETLYLDINSSASIKAQVQVIDISGKVMQIQYVTLNPGKQKLELSTRTLPAGLYQLRIESNEGTVGECRFTKLNK